MKILINFLLVTIFLATSLEAKPVRELSDKTSDPRNQLQIVEKRQKSKKSRKSRKLRKYKQKLSNMRAWKRLKRNSRRRVRKNSRKRSTRTQNRNLERERRVFGRKFLLPIDSSSRRFDRIAKEARFF